MAGIPGLNPGTMKRSGSYIDWAKYSTSLRPGTRVAARPATPSRSGNRSAPVWPIVWQVRHRPFPSAIPRPTSTISGVLRSALMTTSCGRLNLVLRHHLTDIGIERSRREDESADSDGDAGSS